MSSRPSSRRVASRFALHKRAFVVNSIAGLLRYLQKEDWEKVFEVVQERDRDGNPDRFGDWIQDHYGSGGRGYGKSSDKAVQKVLDDPDLIMTLYPEDFSQETFKDYAKYGEWEDDAWYQRDHDAPSWFNLTNPRLLKNQWILHYTNDAEQIARQGFRYGASDLSRLGGRVSNALNERRSSGNFNFGYNTSNADQYVRGHGKYGREAVLLRASGVEAWHSGDQENQVVFAGNTAKDILPLTTSQYDSGWVVGGLGKGGRPDGEGEAFGSLREAVEWAKKNHAQYKRVMKAALMKAFRSSSASRVASRYIEKRAGLLKAPPEMVKEITKWVQTNAARMVAHSSGSVRLSEPVRALAQKHGGAAPPEKDARFSMGLRGWPYLSGFGNDAGKAETLLKLQGFGVIRVRIATDAGNTLATWDNRNLELVVNPFAGNYDLRSKRAYIQWMKRIGSSVNHELQHMTQRIIKVLAGTHEYGGLPSRRIRDHEYTPAGFSVADPKPPKKQYYLRDVEFYTWLSGEVRRFNEYASHAHFPKDRWDEARRSFVDAVNDPMEWGGYMVVDASPFFRALRENEPAKWRKAVGEFWKATEQPVARVASRHIGARSRCRGCGGPIRHAPHHPAMEGYCGYCAFDEFDM